MDLGKNVVKLYFKHETYYDNILKIIGYRAIPDCNFGDLYFKIWFFCGCRNLRSVSNVNGGQIGAF